MEVSDHEPVARRLELKELYFCTGRLIRQRYRRAAELSRVRGKLSCLLINDIDAGIGHFQNTQITVRSL